MYVFVVILLFFPPPQGETDCHTSDVGHWFARTRLFTLPCHFYICVLLHCGTGEPVPYDASFIHCAHRGATGETDCHTSVSTGSQRHGGFTQPCHFFIVRVRVPQGRRIATPVCAPVRNDTFIYAAVSFLHSPVISRFTFSLFTITYYFAPATPVCALVRKDTGVLRSRVIFSSCVSV